MLPRIITRGDHEAARLLAREGIRQLNILKNLMSFGNLKQDVRRVRFTNGSEIICRSIFGIDDVQIYVPEKGPKEKKKYVGRFFAKVRRGGLHGEVKFYWILFAKNGKVSIRFVESSAKILDRMASTPFTTARATNSFTKSFMVKNDNGKEERWIAAPHLLVKENDMVDKNGNNKKVLIEMFNPLGYPHGQTNLTGDNYRYYPLPHFCIPLFYEYSTHPCPPNRFYCNTDKRTMVWYSCYTAIDNTIPEAPVLIHYCFGIILTLTDNMVSEKYYSPGSGTEYQKIIDSKSNKELVKVFFCRSSEIDDRGFDRYWYFRKPDPVCPGDSWCGVDEEVPYQMLTDVNYLDNDKIEIFLPWGARPVKITVDLTDSAVGRTYEAVTSSKHWFWSKDGFEQKVFVDFFQEFHDGASDYISDSGGGPGSDCAGLSKIECNAGCGYGVGNVTNKDWSRSRTIDYGYCDKHSKYKINIFDRKVFSESFRLLGRRIVEDRHANIEYCEWQTGMGCTGPNTLGWDSKSTMDETTEQKVVDSVIADWTSPNIIFVGQEIKRLYANSSAMQMPISPGSAWGSGCVNAPDCFGRCFTGPAPLGCEGQGCFGEARCFIGYPFELADPTNFTPHWAAAPTEEHYVQTTDGCERYRTLNKDEFSDPLVLQYQVDGEGYFPSTLFNKTYYLDDRSSINSDGLLVAARGAEVVDFELDEETLIPGKPIFDVARWSIIYKSLESQAFIDITNELLKVLDCDQTELIELGLI